MPKKLVDTITDWWKGFEKAPFVEDGKRSSEPDYVPAADKPRRKHASSYLPSRAEKAAYKKDLDDADPNTEVAEDMIPK